MYEAIDTIAPAPAQMPSIAQMIGAVQVRISFTRLPVMRVKVSSPFMSILVRGPMMSCTSPPEQKLPPVPVITIERTSSTYWNLWKVLRSSA